MRGSDVMDVPVDLQSGIFHIERADHCLLRRSKRAIQSAKCFDLIKIFSPLRTGEVWRSLGSKLRGTLDRKGLHLCDPRKQRRYRNGWCARGCLISARTAAEDVRHVCVSSITTSRCYEKVRYFCAHGNASVSSESCGKVADIHAVCRVQ